MAVSQGKLLGAVYQGIFRDKLALINTKILGPLVTIKMSFKTEGTGAYTTIEGKDGYRITIGGKLISQIASLPKEFETRDHFLPFRKGIAYAFYGLNFHELGHDKFTDMHDRIIIDYPEVKYRGFLHQLFNLIEDPIQEVLFANFYKKKYPWDRDPKVYFNYMIEKLFKPQCEAYKDTGDIGSFMNYLLLIMRCGKGSIPNNNAVWDKYESQLLPKLRDIIYDIDGTSRLHKCVALGEWMIENIKEFDWNLPEPPEIEKKSGSRPEGPTMPGGDDGDPGSIDPGEYTDPGSKKEDKESEEEKKSTDKSKDGESKGKEEDEISDSPDVGDIFNDMFDEDFHEWCICKDEYTPDDEITDILDNEIEEYSDLINDVTKFLELFNSRIRPRRTSGQLSGKLNVRKAMQNDIVGGCDIKLFDKDIKRGEAPDIAVSLLCDNSGSMTGQKSHICAKAALVLAQACEWANIPFECNAFTKTSDTDSGICITLKVKDFEESFDAAKPYFAINDDDLIGHLNAAKYIPTFCGNSEEVNIYYIWQKLLRNPHKQKILFVLCDGGTTGSREDLASIIKQVEDSGIMVIGLGVLTRDVQGIYPNHKIFNSISELEELSQYLIDTIGGLVTTR